jgi:hypothetical protein
MRRTMALAAVAVFAVFALAGCASQSATPAATTTRVLSDSAKAQVIARQVCASVSQIIDAGQSSNPDTDGQIANLIQQSTTAMAQARTLDSAASGSYSMLEQISTDITSGDYTKAVAGIELVNDACNK